ncbi:MAG: S-layer homology domain-containing protein [Clostridia bacterium]|nr:S-layer homology domain-containing protein [Clostridia bacterium]
MKRILAFAISAVLLYSFCTAVFADFSDHEKIGAAYRTAVADMTARGVLNGFPDGSFQPQGTLTREQGAKIIAYMALGEEVGQLTCTSAPFDDVKTDRWSAPCISWCAERQILLGYGDGRFGPEDTLTGEQFSKMLLCALGLAREGNYVGLGVTWADAVREDGKAAGIYAGDASMGSSAPISREQAALLAYNAQSSSETVKAGGSITLTKEKHPELDFTWHESYLNYAICDFAFTPSGNLLLLQMSDSVAEYTPGGELVGVYSYPFAEEGQTAYMLAADSMGNFYFADGRNNLILKANRENLLGSSHMGEDVPELTLSSQMSAVRENVVCLDTLDAEFEKITAEIDVSSADARLLSMERKTLFGSVETSVRRIPKDGRDWSPEAEFRIKWGDGVSETVHVRSNHKGEEAIFGLKLAGLADSETLIGYIREFVLNEAGQESMIETWIKIRRGQGITQITDQLDMNSMLTRTYNGQTWILLRQENGIRIMPLSQLADSVQWSSEHWYVCEIRQ